MPNPTIKPLTNVSLYGTIKNAWYSLSKRAKEEGWPAQVKLSGRWTSDNAMVGDEKGPIDDLEGNVRVLTGRGDLPSGV